MPWHLPASQAALAGAPIEFSVRDVLAQDLPGNFDVAISSLFFHHIDEDSAVRLLQKMAAGTRHLVLVNDLRRSLGGVMLAFLASRLFTRSDVVWTDALRSVRAAFTAEEAMSLAERAGPVPRHSRASLAMSLSPCLGTTVMLSVSPQSIDSTMSVVEAARRRWDVVVIGAGPRGIAGGQANRITRGKGPLGRPGGVPP